MENYDYNILKKKYGENFARLCRKFFPTLLEKKGVLSGIITEKFAENKFLYDDIVNANLKNKFKEYIYSFVEYNSDIKEEVIESPYELMRKAGYTLYKCETEEDIIKFAKYYEIDEYPCTFHDGDRTAFYYVFFAVKDNAVSLDRYDFENPQRQDEYGTSVISIQFAKLSRNTYFITNRYNHAVENPDATFSNDLNNIIFGLTKSFEKEFGFVFETEKKQLHIPNYITAANGKQYKINNRIDSVSFGVDNVLIDRYNSVKEFNKDKYLLFDYFLLNLSDGSIEMLADTYEKDSFVDAFKDVSKVQVKKHSNGKTLTLSTTNGKDFFIELDKHNGMVKYTNENIKKIENNFLMYRTNIKEINLPNAKEIRNAFMMFNENLEKINAENLIKAGHGFLRSNNGITKINFPKLVEVGKEFMYQNKTITKVNLPSLKETGDNFLHSHPRHEEIVERLLAEKKQGNGREG